MYLVVLVLNKVELLEQVLDELVRAGICGATILDSTGMGRALANSHDDSILAGIRSIFQYSRPHNKTVFFVVQTREQSQSAVVAVKKVLGDMNRPGVGIIFTLPVLDVSGIPNNQHE